MTDQYSNCCSDALPGDAAMQQNRRPELKELARKALVDAAASRNAANAAIAATDATAARDAITKRLQQLARTLGIPRAVVDALPPDELEATAAQAAMCEGYVDGNGDPLARALLVFYLKALAKRLNA